ncbi:phd finger protein, putative [Babesia caballi]|uniref:Phd finger protein, putative n=1 Tax=Babesia caballi TaxID=5871 RepID=A0AAV4LUI4_BABCB|nr:phd finger protein, putative [Babesia caballi]
MKEMLFGAGRVLSSHAAGDDDGVFVNAGSDVPEEEVLTCSSMEESDNGSSLNGSLSHEQAAMAVGGSPVECVADFGEVGSVNGIAASPQSCAECGLKSGPFLACGACDLLYHSKCLMQCFLPTGDGVWKCPQCQWKLINAGEVPLDATLNHCDLSDDSHTGYDTTRSPVPQEDVSDEASGQEKEPKAKVARAGSSPTRERGSEFLERKRKKPVTEGSNFQTKINVGFSHQVPFTPAFFLDDSHGPQPDNHDWARLMYSPYYLEKIRTRKLQEGARDNVIKNEFELAEYIQLCAQNWKSNPGWHPFSPEFAYKILHFADYDPKKALKVMNDPNFNFLCVCDPPTRRYDNKWKPKDRRGQVPTSPYPPPVTLRGYLLRRHDNSR